jgi:3-deoxy-D-manno-octulosonic-acid transferase
MRGGSLVMKGTILLPTYRLATAAFAPFAPLFLNWREKQGLEDRARLSERLGVTQQSRLPGPLAWLHGASLGESLALLPLLERLAARGFNILLSTGTVTSAAVIAPRLPPRAVHQFIPLDVPRFMAQFLNHWRPDIVFIAESEIWPNLFLETHRRRIPILLVNAHMSARSFQRWRRVPKFSKALFEMMGFCIAQSRLDAERFAQIGAPHVQVGGNLKYDVSPPPAASQALADLKARIGGRPVWVAAATHAGEEEIIFDAHRKLLQRFSSALTIIVPRHPRRGKAIRDLAIAQSLRCQLRSEDSRERPLDSLYIADTVGETGLFYRLAEIAFLGKSLAGGGGQSPIEAAKLGCAILHGPDVGNFTEVYDRLDGMRGAATIVDADTLAATLIHLFMDAAKMRDMARSAAEVVESLSGTSDFIMQMIEPYIAQLIIEQLIND